jgi:hypothetical protein
VPVIFSGSSLHQNQYNPWIPTLSAITTVRRDERGALNAAIPAGIADQMLWNVDVCSRLKTDVQQANRSLRLVPRADNCSRLPDLIFGNAAGAARHAQTYFIQK